MHEYNLPPDSPLTERLNSSSADGCLDPEIKLARACAEALAAQGNVGSADLPRPLGGWSKRNQALAIESRPPLPRTTGRDCTMDGDDSN